MLTDFDRALGRRLQTARKAAGYRQETIAYLLNVSRSQIANIEAGRSTISAYQVSVFARQYGQPVGYFYEELPISVPQPVPPSPDLVAQARTCAVQLLAWVGNQS